MKHHAAIEKISPNLHSFKMHRIKILILGNQNTGKTSLRRQFLEKRHSNLHRITLTSDCAIKKYKNKQLFIIDSGRYFDRQLLRNIDVVLCLLPFDCSILELLKSTNCTPLFIICKNKCDVEVLDNDVYLSGLEIINQLFGVFNVPLFNVSSKTGQGVEELFDYIVKHANYTSLSKFIVIDDCTSNVRVNKSCF